MEVRRYEVFATYNEFTQLNRYFLYEMVLSNSIQQLIDHAPSVCL